MAKVGNSVNLLPPPAPGRLQFARCGSGLDTGRRAPSPRPAQGSREAARASNQLAKPSKVKASDHIAKEISSPAKREVAIAEKLSETKRNYAKEITRRGR